MNCYANTQKLVLIALICLMSFTSYATTYFVATSGIDDTDARRGTEGFPYRTIKYALTRISGTGHTIQLKSEVFTEPTQIVLPSGISLVGNGAANTTLRVNLFFDLESQTPNDCGDGKLRYAHRPDKFIIQMNGSNQRVANLKLDGQTRTCHGGIFMQDGSSNTFEGLDVINFKYCGLWILKSSNVTIRNNKFTNSAYGNKAGAFGNIMFYDATNMAIYNNTITQNFIGSYGIKVHKNDLNRCFTTAQERDERVRATSSDVRIYNNVIDVKDFGTWSSGVPAITIEATGTSIRNWEIRDNVLNNHISIPANNKASDGYQVDLQGKPAARIHHNTYNHGDRYAYALEANCGDLEFDHNYVNGGNYPIAQWGGKEYSNHKIHHNIFYNIKANNNLIKYEQAPNNLKVYNNTFLDLRDFNRIVEISGTKTATGAEFINNIFASTNATAKDRFPEEKFPDAVWKNNLFYNIDPIGSPALTSAPWFRGSFDNTLRKPSPYFELNSVSPNISPALNAGTAITGFTGNAIGVPDLGALESGVNNANSWAANPNAVGARGDAGASARQAAEQVSTQSNEGPSTRVYPNPSADGEIYVEVANAAEVGLEFRTVLGTAVPFTKQVLDERKLRLKPQGRLDAGMYIITIKEQYQQTSQKVIIK